MSARTELLQLQKQHAIAEHEKKMEVYSAQQCAAIEQYNAAVAMKTYYEYMYTTNVNALQPNFSEGSITSYSSI